jgi:hypothetical protein
VATTAHAQADHTRKRQLEESVIWTGRERLRFLWYRLRLVVQEINYASKRMVELQLRLPDDWAVLSCEQHARRYATPDRHQDEE